MVDFWIGALLLGAWVVVAGYIFLVRRFRRRAIARAQSLLKEKSPDMAVVDITIRELAQIPSADACGLRARLVQKRGDIWPSRRG